jgi:hypothetical protein
MPRLRRSALGLPPSGLRRRTVSALWRTAALLWLRRRGGQDDYDPREEPNHGEARANETLVL